MALTITVQITDTDQAALENDLLDVDAWVQAAVAGKVNSCKKRMAKETVAILQEDASVTSMPASTDELIAVRVARPDYLNRAAREVV